MFVRRLSPIFSVLLLVVLASSLSAGQNVRSLRSPAVVHGFIGGESHDTYVVHTRKRQTLTVVISWKPEHDPNTGDNHAQFWIQDSSNYGGEAVKFGRESDNGKRWSGEIPSTGNYYIFVVAHPTAHYNLKVQIK